MKRDLPKLTGLPVRKRVSVAIDEIMASGALENARNSAINDMIDRAMPAIEQAYTDMILYGFGGVIFENGAARAIDPLAFSEDDQ